MDKIEVKSKYFKGTIRSLENGDNFVLVQDKRIEDDFEATIASIKERENCEENKAQSLLKQALREIMVEMRKVAYYMPQEETKRNFFVEKECERIRAQRITEMYLSECTLETLFLESAYACLNEFGRKNRKKQLANYAKRIHAFISFLLKKKPCKELDSEIRLDKVEEIIHPIAVGKLQSKGFPFFLLFYVMVIVLPEDYILRMLNETVRKKKSKYLAEVRREISHLYDYEYVVDNNYLLEKVKVLRNEIFDIYCSVMDEVWIFVKAELVTQKSRMGYMEREEQELAKVLCKEKDVELDGYLYLYEAFMKSKFYRSTNNFYHMLEILKRYLKDLEVEAEERTSNENRLNENKIKERKKRNRTKVDKYRKSIVERMEDFYGLNGECIYETQRDVYIKKSIYFFLDLLTMTDINGKKFPRLGKKKFDTQKQQQEYTYAMKFFDCMLVYFVKCYDDEVVPDIFERYCNAMKQRYMRSNVQSAGCDELEMSIDEINRYYNIYEEVFEFNVYKIMKELLLDKDIAELLYVSIIKLMWQSLSSEFDDGLLVKDVFSEEDVGSLAMEKDFRSLDKKLKKDMQRALTE